MKCPYCEDDDIKKRKIIENDLARAFPTNIPVVPGHVLVVPKRHVSRFDEMTEEERKSIFEIRRKICRSLVNVFGATGFNYAWNEGETAGQTIQHFHLHILPRKEGDTGITGYDPRKFLYRPGSREKSREQELIAVAKLIKSKMD